MVIAGSALTSNVPRSLPVCLAVGEQNSLERHDESVQILKKELFTKIFS